MINVNKLANILNQYQQEIMKMKAQIYKSVRKQLVVVLMIMSFMAGAYAQKSAFSFKEDSNFRYLRSLAAVISQIENDYAAILVKPIEQVEVRFDNNLKFEEFVLEPEYSANEIFLVNEEEEKIQVEEWMMDEDHFRNDKNDDELNEIAEEEKLVIEDWMLDESHFISDNNAIGDEISTEDELEVEDWMLNPEHWVLRAD